MLEVFAELYQIYPLSEGCIEDLSKAISFKSIPKKGFLLKAGQVMQHSYYIKKGLIRAFLKNGNSEVTSFFMTEGDIFVNPESYYGQIPSHEYIQALEDSEVIYTSKADTDAILQKHLEFNFVSRVITEKYNAVQWQYNRITKLKPAEVRYKVFSELFPNLVDRIDDKYIASFLATSQWHFSKMKRKK